MKYFFAVVLCILLPVSSFAASAGYKVSYDGGSIPEKAGTAVFLYIEANQIRLAQKSEVLATIPAASVTEISYGQDVHRRVEEILDRTHMENDGKKGGTRVPG